VSTRHAIAEALQNGDQLQGMIVSGGVILAQGMLKWEGTIWGVRQNGMATELRIDWKGEQFTAPLEQRVYLERGGDCRVEFGRKWR